MSPPVARLVVWVIVVTAAAVGGCRGGEDEAVIDGHVTAEPVRGR